jgi:hypothetical protein
MNLKSGTISMNLPSTQVSSWLEILSRAFMAVVCLAALVAVVHPDIRSLLRTQIQPTNQREVLATITAPLSEGGAQVKVVKIRTPQALILEVFETGENTSGSLLQHIELPDKRDGYFTFNGEATNLAIDDIDGDNQAEIIVPSFDENLVAHLNIFRFQSETRQFELVQQQN